MAGTIQWESNGGFWGYSGRDPIPRRGVEESLSLPVRVIDRRQNPGQPTQLSAFDERVGRQMSVRSMTQADEKCSLYAAGHRSPQKGIPLCVAIYLTPNRG